MTALPNKQYTKHTKIQRKKVDWSPNQRDLKIEREMWSAGFQIQLEKNGSRQHKVHLDGDGGLGRMLHWV